MTVAANQRSSSLFLYVFKSQSVHLNKTNEKLRYLQSASAKHQTSGYQWLCDARKIRKKKDKVSELQPPMRRR